MANELRIRIGASVDASVANAFTQIEKAAAHAAGVIRKQMAEAGVSAARGAAVAATQGENAYRRTGTAAEGAARRTRQAADSANASMGKLATGAAAKFAALSSGLKKLPNDLNLVAREAQRALQQLERDKARAALGLSPSAAPRRYWSAFGGNLSIRKPNLSTLQTDPVRGVARFGIGAASMAKRAALGLAHDVGVNTDFGSAIGKNVSEEQIAQDIVNAGYFPGQTGAAGELQSRGDILGQTRQVAIDTGNSRGDVLEGLRDFVGKTGDLQLGRDLMGDMAKLAKATGANMADMVNAAAEVSNNLGDVENKGSLVNEVMRQIAGQGKLGAVEIRDLATQMSKIAGVAGQFKGGAQKNIAVLGVLAQEAKLHGGATNATQATTSVARFVTSLGQGKVIRNLKNARLTETIDGKKVTRSLTPFTDATQTQFRDPMSIIKDMLSWSHGDIQKLQGLMPGSIGMKPIQGLAYTYRNTKGTDEEKLAAVTAEFENMQRAMLTTDEVNRAFAEAMTTSQSKVTVFNEKMAQVAEEMAGSLLPALESLGPVILDLAKSGLSAIDSFGRWFSHMPQSTSEVAKETGDEQSRMKRSNALASELEAAKNAPVGSGQFKLARNEITGQMVATHGTIDKGHIEKAEADAAARKALIEQKERELEKMKAEHRKADANAPSAEYDTFGTYAAEAKQRTQDERNSAKEIENLKEFQARQVAVLENIHQALISGEVTFKQQPTQKPPGAPGAAPAPAGANSEGWE